MIRGAAWRALAFCILSTGAHGEPYWMSEPGLCHADDGVIEEADAIYLTQTGMGNHFFSCTWSARQSRALLSGAQFAVVKATCSNDTTTWKAELEIVKQGDGSVRVFQQSGGISPVRFFRCD